MVFLETLAAENLKNTIPAPLCRGMGHRVPPIPSGNRVFGVFSCRKPQKHDSRPALSLSRDGVWPIPSGNRVFGVYSCRKPQKHDSRPALSHIPPIPSENRVFSCRVFSCRKPQKHDSRPALSQDGASGPPRSVARWGIGSRQFRAKIVFLEFLAAENLKIPAPLCRGMEHRVPPIPSGNRVFGVFSCRKPQKTRFPPRSFAGWGIRSRANRVFGVFSCRKPQKHDSRPALSRDGASGPANSAGIVFLEFFSCRKPQKHDSRPALSRDGASGPANSERESCFGSRKPQKQDSRLGHRVRPIPSGNRVFGVFSCRKPQKHDSRPTLSRDGASGPANSEQESCFWSF